MCLELRELKAVDPCEIMAYKIIELLKIGPEVIFYHDSIEDFYIATKDAGAEFLRFDHFMQSDECGESLWGNLVQVISRYENARKSMKMNLKNQPETLLFN